MLNRLRDLLLDFFFPPRCVICRAGGVWLCAACSSALPRMKRPLCPRCARPLLSSTCHKRHTFVALDSLDAVSPFRDNVREVIHALKYKRVRALAVPLGSMLAEVYAHARFQADVVVPVPLHTGRLKERGYNQSALLAEQLATHAHLPLLTDSLERCRATNSQTHLSASARVENVRNAFACRGTRMIGKRIILIDDVCTTGATIEASAVALKAAGASRVYGLVLARAVDM